MSNTTTIILKPGKEKSLLRFHPWVFSGAIRHVNGVLQEGDLVEVTDSSGRFLGQGHYQPGSISVRLVSFEPHAVDKPFWVSKFEKALALRHKLNLTSSAQTNMYRLIHGEGDQLPGLIVDIYGSTAVLQAHSAGMYSRRHQFADILMSVMGGKIRSVYEKSKSTLPFRSQAHTGDGYLVGERNSEALWEYSNQFEVSWEEGQKTGFFLDQRENRKLLETYSSNAAVLNTFGYTGGFSVYAARGGAKSVASVDSSQRAIELTTRNMELNGVKPSAHTEVCTDVFEFLKEDRTLYDVIVLDPPAFAKHTPALKNALQAYIRLNAAAMRKLNSGGMLFTFSCSQVVTREQFRNTVFSAGVMTHREVCILHQLTQPADHPVNIYHPEGEYLKGLVLNVR